MNDKKVVMLGTAFETMGGISAVVNTYRRTGLFERLSIVYIPTHSDGSAGKKIMVFLCAWVQFIRTLLAGGISLVHVHTASEVSFWRKLCFIVPALLGQTPVLIHLHGAEFDNFYENLCGVLRKRIIREVFNKACAVIVLSESWSGWVNRISTNPNIIVVNNPVELPKTNNIFNHSNASILSLGRLGSRKGTYDLLHAMKRLVVRHPSLQLILGGDGDVDTVKSEASRLGISANVKILGWVTGASKSQLLETSMVYALPSYAEGLPVSVLEAMAARLPVVSTSVGGIPELVTNGVEGMLIEPGDVDALTRALNMLLENPALRTQMGYAGRKKVEMTFSTDKVLPQIEQIYKKFEKLT